MAAVVEGEEVGNTMESSKIEALKSEQLIVVCPSCRMSTKNV